MQSNELLFRSCFLGSLVRFGSRAFFQSVILPNMLLLQFMALLVLVMVDAAVAIVVVVAVVVTSAPTTWYVHDFRFLCRSLMDKWQWFTYSCQWNCHYFFIPIYCFVWNMLVIFAFASFQVKVWFQNRRTKHKRVKSDDEGDNGDISVDDDDTAIVYQQRNGHSPLNTWQVWSIYSLWI